MLIVMALFTNSCTEDDNILINCQDPNNDCFMDAPSIESISSYSPNSIYFSFSNLSNESLQLQRSIDNVVDTTYVLEQNYYGELIDTVNINYNTYNYLLRYKNELGISNPIEFNITHDFPGVLEESFEISTINENATRLDWYYNIDDHFTKSYNDIEWIISKEKFNSQSNTWNNYSDIILNEFISNDNYYSYTDNYDISFSDSLRYTISLNLDNFISTLTTSNIRVNFPQLESIEWVPLNSSTILLNWKIDNTLSDNLTSVKITNTRSNDYIYETNESIFESSIIDDISLYNDNVIANEIIEYTIEWCGSSMCADTTFSAKTFPYYHMQYIPSFNNLI